MLRVTALILALVCSGPALACGNPMLWAMLFARMPEAKAVFDADLAARESGGLHARVFDDATPGVEDHRWSMAWISDAAHALNSSVTAGLADGDRVTVLLADAVVAMRFEVGAAPRVISAAGLDFQEGFDLITTVNALESGIAHGFDADRLADLGVLVTTRAGQSTAVARLF